MRRLLLKLLALGACGALVSCGSSGNPVSGVTHQIFAADMNLGTGQIPSGGLYILNAKNDQIANQFNYTGGGQSTILLSDQSGGPAVPIYLVPIGSLKQTLVASQSPSTSAVISVDDVRDTQNFAVNVAGYPDATVVTSDGLSAFVAISSASEVSKVDLQSTKSITANVSVVAPYRLALSPDDKWLFVFSRNADTFTIVSTYDLSTKTVSGAPLSRPDGAFFTSDSKTAYVLSCGPECGGTGAANVTSFDPTVLAPTPIKTATVDGATAGALDASGNLYVAGSPTAGPGNGRLDIVGLSSMTVSKTAAIGDGTHTSLVFTPAGSLYIGAANCTNDPNSATPSGCLSVYHPSNGSVVIESAGGSEPAGGDVGGILPLTNGRNIIYVAVGGKLIIYDGTTDQPYTKTQLHLTGFISDLILPVQ